MRAGTLAPHRGAATGRRCRSARCSRWSRRRSVPEAEIDAFVAQFVARRASAEAATEDATPAAPREIEAGGRRLRCLELGERRRRRRCCWCTASAATSTPGCSPSRRWPKRRRTIALDLPGHGGSTKDVGAGDAEMLRRRGRRTRSRALGIERVHLVGHSMGGAIALSLAARAAGAGREPDPDRAGRARAGDQRRLHRRLRPRRRAAARRRRRCHPGARPVAGQPRDGRGGAALQAARRRRGGAGDDRARLVPRRPPGARPACRDRAR